MSCNPLLADDRSMKNSKDDLDRVVMSSFDLNEFIDVAGFLVWEHMVERGWLVFSFNAIKKRPAYVDFQQRNLLKHGNMDSETNHEIKGEVRVQQFDIMCINREETCGDQFSVRITFISEATKTVVQSCQEHKTVKNSDVLYNG